MKISFEITGLEPLTLNHTHKITTKNGRKTMYKTLSYKQFESYFSSKMRNQRVSVNKINKYFDDKIHCLHIDYIFYYQVMTKGGKLNLKSKDVDNMIKPVQDCLFKNFMFDDAYVTKVSSEKIHSEVSRIDINIRIINLK